MKMIRLTALAGSVLTLIQMLLLVTDNPAICLNDGCKVVDSLTTVSPLVINLAGFAFFQLVFWGVWAARGDSEQLGLVRLLLSAAMGIEGVLVSFQYVIAQTFCSYCLIIFGLILLLNILAGMRQLIGGGVVFLAVLVAFASLQFSTVPKDPMQDLDRGSMATIGTPGEVKRYLFFSSSCKYCEKVIASLEGDNGCGISFNPIDTIERFKLSSATIADSHDTSVNRAFLQAYSLKQIPVLLIQSSSGFQVITGAGGIEQYLDGECRSKPTGGPVNTQPVSGYSQPGGLDFLSQDEGSCSVETDCDDPALLEPK